MSRSLVLAVVIGIALTATTHAQFRGGVDLVSLTVTVTDPQQQLVRDLKATDFSVLEDGVQQTVTFFGADDVPLDLAVMIDCSASMDEKLPDVQRAAIGLVRSLGTGDRAEVISFRDDMGVRQTMTTDHASVVRAIESLHAEGNTSLFTALYVTLRQMASAQPSDVRRRAVVLLSDGEDTHSLVTFDDVMDLARRSGVAIYTVALDSRIDRVLNTRGVTEGQFAMRGLAEATGARAFFPAGLGDIRGVYGAIAAELRSQYSIGYLPRNAVGDGAWRRVAVQVTARPGSSARVRPGYFASPGLAALTALLKR